MSSKVKEDRKKKRRYRPDDWLTPPISMAMFVFVIVAASAMGALAFLQFTDWGVPFYIFASIPLPTAIAFIIWKILVPALNKDDKDDKEVNLVAFVIYYLAVIIGWAMIWMIIWHIKPNSYHGIDTFDPKDAYNVFGYVLVGATFVSFGTAPTFVLPEALISCLVSGVQVTISWLVSIIFFAFIARIILKRYDEV